MANDVKHAYIDIKKAIEKVNKVNKNIKFMIAKPNEEITEGNWVFDKNNSKELKKSWKNCKDYIKRWDEYFKLLTERGYQVHISRKDEYINI